MFNHVGCPPLQELNAVTDEVKGRFYTTPEGNEYPSITTVLGQTSDKSWLKEWKESLGEKVAAKETARCADRGETVHSLAERYLNNEQYILDGNTMENVKMFNQLKMRLRKINNIRTQEAPLYSDFLGIAGRVDCVGEYKGQLCIIDFKTSNGIKTRDMVGDYFLQCTAYALMWYELTGERIDHLTILMAVEKSAVSMIFQDKIDKYVKPLQQRIDTFYQSQGLKHVV